VEDVARVEVVQANAYLDEETPHSILVQIFVFTLFCRMLPLSEQRVQVSVLAKLHHDVHFLTLRDERVVVFNYVWRVELSHYVNLSQCFVVFPK